ncbi:DUF456 domain-containing protein [Chloroflexota bacterium]
MTQPLGTVALVLALIVMLVGVIGTVVPVIPGTVLIFLAALVYAVLDGFQTVGWPSLIVLGLLTVVATTADIWASGVGARLGGASGWSVVAGLVGGLLGFLLFTLPGAILGAIAGVLGSEIVRVRDWKLALKAGSGWLVGWILSTVVQLGAGLTMVAIFVYQVWRGA